MSNRKVNRVKSRKVNEAKTGPGTMGVVRDLLDVMNKNGLTKIHVTKSTLEALAGGGEVKTTQSGNTVKFSVGDGKGFSTLESVGRRHRVSTKGNRFISKITESMTPEYFTGRVPLFPGEDPIPTSMVKDYDNPGYFLIGIVLNGRMEMMSLTGTDEQARELSDSLADLDTLLKLESLIDRVGMTMRGTPLSILFL